MKITYYPDTDTLYIDLKEIPGESTIEVAEDVVIDATRDGRPVGIEIEHASGKVDLSVVKTEGMVRESIDERSRTEREFRTMLAPSGAGHSLISVRNHPLDGIKGEDSTAETDSAKRENRRRLLSVG